MSTSRSLGVDIGVDSRLTPEQVAAMNFQDKVCSVYEEETNLHRKDFDSPVCGEPGEEAYEEEPARDEWEAESAARAIHPSQFRFFSNRVAVFAIEQDDNGNFVPRVLSESRAAESAEDPYVRAAFDAYKVVAQRVADAWGKLVAEYPELQQSDTELEPKLVALLLARLNTAVINADKQLGNTSVKPKRLGVERYFHPACVLLPNGIPVSFSLLLGGQKGRRGPLSDIPDTIKLLAISRVLQEEEPTELLSDADIAEGTAEELEKLGYKDVPLTDKKISAFRDRLAKQNGLETIVPEKLFPNQRTRGEIYAQAGLVETQS